MKQNSVNTYNKVIQYRTAYITEFLMFICSLEPTYKSILLYNLTSNKPLEAIYTKQSAKNQVGGVCSTDFNEKKHALTKIFSWLHSPSAL